MFGRNGVSRRGFVGGVASALGYLSFKSPSELWAQARGGGGALQPRPRAPGDLTPDGTSATTRLVP